MAPYKVDAYQGVELQIRTLFDLASLAAFELRTWNHWVRWQGGSGLIRLNGAIPCIANLNWAAHCVVPSSIRSQSIIPSMNRRMSS